MPGRPQTLTKGQREEVTTIFRNKILTWILVSLAIITGVSGLSLWGIKTRLESKLETDISKQFEVERIKATLTSVAEGQASTIIRDELTPSIKQANLKIDKRISIFESRLHEFENSYSELISQLSEEVEYLKQRSRIMKLGSEALASGESTPYESLLEILEAEDNEEYQNIASSEIYKIKTNFATMTRTKGVSLKWTNQNPKLELIDKEIPTEALLNGLRELKNWKQRAKAAELLSDRKQKGVPEALLLLMSTDSHLEVRKNAKMSFERITGYTGVDVFDSVRPRKWWLENQDQQNKKLEEMQTILDFLKEYKTHNKTLGENSE